MHLLRQYCRNWTMFFCMVCLSWRIVDPGLIMVHDAISRDPIPTVERSRNAGRLLCARLNVRTFSVSHCVYEHVTAAYGATSRRGASWSWGVVAGRRQLAGRTTCRCGCRADIHCALWSVDNAPGRYECMGSIAYLVFAAIIHPSI